MIVLIYSGDPGAASYARYLPRVMARLGYSSRLYASEESYRFLLGNNVESKQWNIDSVDAVLRDVAPIAVFIGSSVASDSPGLDLIEKVRVLGIPTIGIIDAMMNPQLRFRGNSDNPLQHQPDYLFVTDRKSCIQFHELGVPFENMFVTGHPHYLWLTEYLSEQTEQDVWALRGKEFPQLVPWKPTILFVAEPPVPDEHLSRRVGEIQGWDDTEERTHLALQSLIDERNNLSVETRLIVRLHPKNHQKDFEQYENHVDLVIAGGNPTSSVICADIVVGLTSSLVVEASIIGRPTASIVTHQKDGEEIPEFVSDRISQVYSRKQLSTFLNDSLSAEFDMTPLQQAAPLFDEVVSDAVARILKPVDNNLEPNVSVKTEMSGIHR